MLINRCLIRVHANMAMLHSATCYIEITEMEGLLEVSCKCHIVTEEGVSPYEMSVWSEIEVHELSAYIQRCLFLFRGLKEITVTENDPNWEPTEAAHFAYAMIESVEDGTDFDMLAWEII